MKVSQLTLAYAQKNILENINFFVKTHLCILGANGSGKSTLAKALCGLIDYQGSLLLSDQELRNINPVQRAKLITYIPAKMQSFEQFTTVEDFVLLGRYPYKNSFKDYTQEDKNIVNNVLRELNIFELSHFKLHELSSGQQQLILIAQALAQQSKILIFDEPTANLDPKNTLLFVKELTKLRKKHTVILITHDIQLASHFKDPVLFLEDKKATFYEKDFFQLEILKNSYGVNFLNENNLLGISYE